MTKTKLPKAYARRLEHAAAIRSGNPEVLARIASDNETEALDKATKSLERAQERKTLVEEAIAANEALA